jgi:hypothetical protein
VQRVPFQATRCPCCTCDLESALVRVEPARAEASPLEQERSWRVSFQQPVCTGAMHSSVWPPVPGGHLGCPGRAPPDARWAHHPTPAVKPSTAPGDAARTAGSGRSSRSSAGAGSEHADARVGGEGARRGWSEGAQSHCDTRSHTNSAARGSRQSVMREDPDSIHRLVPTPRMLPATAGSGAGAEADGEGISPRPGQGKA